MEGIREILSGRSSIVIAHRLSTIRECEQILVLEKGKIVEKGGYTELLRHDGLFKRFHEIHSRS